MGSLSGISPLVSTVILIAIVMAIAAIVSPWAYEIVYKTTNDTSGYQQQHTTCQNTGFTFDTGYGTHGLDWNLSGASDTLSAKVVNSGSINLKGFSFEISMDTTSGYVIYNIELEDSYQKTSSNPLKPGESALLKANMTQDYNGTLKSVKILNSVCPSAYIEQEI